jgi:hypothetical protein
MSGVTQRNSLYSDKAKVGMGNFLREAVLQRLTSLGIDRRKMFQYLGLFFVVLIFALICISMYVRSITGPAYDAYVRAFFGRIFKLSLIAAIPFAMLAWFDQNWRSSDAAPVLAAAWSAAYAALSTKCRICMLGAGIPFVIFTFCALLGHMAGTLCRFLKYRDLSPIGRL